MVALQPVFRLSAVPLLIHDLTKDDGEEEERKDGKELDDDNTVCTVQV